MIVLPENGKMSFENSPGKPFETAPTSSSGGMNEDSEGREGDIESWERLFKIREMERISCGSLNKKIR
jgi:hypothetical protein